MPPGGTAEAGSLQGAEPGTLVAFHATVRVKPDQRGRFIEWKRAEAAVQQQAYGFVKSLVLEPVDQPRTFHYLSFWNAPDALARHQQDPAFIDLSARFGVPMYPPAVRDGEASGALYDPGNHPLLAGPVERYRCSVLIDEAGRQPGATNDDPYVFHYFAHTGADGAAAYERFKHAEARLQLDEPGFIKRLLLSRPNDPGAFYYISFWQSSEAAHVFHDRFAQSAEYQATYPQLHPFQVGPTFGDCRLIQDVTRQSLTGVPA
jgi:quinol monooxygenase YgiN